MGTRPEVMNNPKSTHGIGEYFLYGSWRGDMNEKELKWVKDYQNYMGNFIRTGNPNGTLVAPSIREPMTQIKFNLDWTDSPNDRPGDEFIWHDFQHDQKWLQMGHLKFEHYESSEDIRRDRCALLDELHQYMKH